MEKTFTTLKGLKDILDALEDKVLDDALEGSHDYHTIDVSSDHTTGRVYFYLQGYEGGD